MRSTRAAQHTPLPWAALSPVLCARLRAEGIETVGQWAQLGAKRRRIFGVTAAHVAQIDAAIAALERVPA
jgi:hypothetical protein